MTRCPSRALNLDAYVALDYRETRTQSGVAPRTRSRTTDTNLDCASVENVVLFLGLKIGRAWAPLTPLSAPLLRRALVGLT